MGTSTAGIAHAAITAHLLALPMGYVRSGAKDHGRKNQIEGKLLPGQKVVVIEDLISTGGSVLEVVDVLHKAGAQVLGIASIFTYGMKKSVDQPGRGKGAEHQPHRPGYRGPGRRRGRVYPPRGPEAPAGLPG